MNTGPRGYLLCCLAASAGMFLGRGHPMAPPLASLAREECTIGVAAATATQDGRPLLWKTRDSYDTDNEIYYNDSLAIPFIAVVTANGGPESEAWMGVNQDGFAILNALASELAKDTETRTNGEFMRDALGTCRSVRAFVAMLDSTNGLRQTHANFGVIDSTGAAIMFEASPDTYWSFDAREAPGGAIVRTNFACHDTAGSGIAQKPGVERFLRSNILVAELVAAANLNCESLLTAHMRDFSTQAGAAIPIPCADCSSPDGLIGFIDPYWSICRNISVSASVIQGVAADAPVAEPAWLSTMWAILGHPAVSLAVPYWPVGPAPALADGGLTAPLCDRARALRGVVFHCEVSPRLIDSFMLRDGDGGGLWSSILVAEQEIHMLGNSALQSWRVAPSPWSEMLAMEAMLAAHALDALVQLTSLSDGESAAAVRRPLLAQNHPNPFNGGTVVSYEVLAAGRARLAVFDARGREIAVLADTDHEPGLHTATWDARGTASGVYFIHLTAGDRHETRKCVRVR